MKRRDFVKQFSIGLTGLAAAGPIGRLYAAPTDYRGRCLVVLQMDGGWDVTSMCDPKVNLRGELEINHWANRDEPQTAGNISYAPFADNARLFDNYYRDMLVINGVDAQTNSHTTGVIHNWSGRAAEGLPTLGALFSAAQAPEVPLSYLNFGGFASTAGLIRFSRLDNPDSLVSLLNPNLVPWDANQQWRTEAELSRVDRFQMAALRRKLQSPNLTPMQRENINSYLSSRSTQEGLQQLLGVLLPADQFEPDLELGDAGFSNLKRQMQLTVLSFKAGICSASDLMLGGFDTHTTHDELHTPLFAHFADAVDYFWHYAEQHGVADRITLLIGSDFGRTPHYNADDGKDHWPIGSYMVMERGAPWGNRVVGVTDGGHNAHRINPTTLKRDDRRGTLIYPKHVHKALRKYLGVEGFAAANGFDFANTEDFDLFNPAKQT